MMKSKTCKFYQALITEAASNDITSKEACYLEMYIEKYEFCLSELSEFSTIESKFSNIRAYNKKRESKGLSKEINNRILCNIQKRLKDKKVPRFYINFKQIYSTASLFFLSFAFIFIFDISDFNKNLNNAEIPSTTSEKLAEDLISEDLSAVWYFDDVRTKPQNNVIEPAQNYFSVEFDNSQFASNLLLDDIEFFADNFDIEFETLLAQPYSPDYSEFPDASIVIPE